MRSLIQHYRPVPSGDGRLPGSPSSAAKDSLWSVDFFRCESILLKSYWIMVVIDIFTRRIIGFGGAAADLDGPVICQMFNRAIAKQTPPKYLSSEIHRNLMGHPRELQDQVINEISKRFVRRGVEGAGARSRHGHRQRSRHGHRQADVCETHARDLCVRRSVIDRKRRAE